MTTWLFCGLNKFCGYNTSSNFSLLLDMYILIENLTTDFEDGIFIVK